MKLLWGILKILGTSVVVAVLALCLLGMQTTIGGKSVLSGPTIIGRASGDTIQTYWAPAWNGTNGSTQTFSAGNQEELWGQEIQQSLSVGHMVVNVQTADATGSDVYSFGLFNSSGTAVCTTTAVSMTSTGYKQLACSQGTVSIAPGKYYFGGTVNSGAAAVFLCLSNFVSFYGMNTNFAATSSGNQPASISAPSDSLSFNGTAPFFIMLEP